MDELLDIDIHLILFKKTWPQIAFSPLTWSTRYSVLEINLLTPRPI